MWHEFLCRQKYRSLKTEYVKITVLFGVFYQILKFTNQIIMTIGVSCKSKEVENNEFLFANY